MIVKWEKIMRAMTLLAHAKCCVRQKLTLLITLNTPSAQ